MRCIYVGRSNVQCDNRATVNRMCAAHAAQYVRREKRAAARSLAEFNSNLELARKQVRLATLKDAVVAAACQPSQPLTLEVCVLVDRNWHAAVAAACAALAKAEKE